ncbi:type IV secretion system protein VirB10 [Endobacter medicaginis]|uniref:Type IV secretion system protein VirB10 n=1 Tax=Endobacter medicaginis TaxID=1181271 RepID=A0A839V6P7_9PROT|nr:type IV secretion system protein VirB10 [Endobacter medicaginis]MBB3175232.1 type IV secretion system protein VirB10 [Endobacter medicaginis]MCX5476284.1 type IV secretion system protein VirB10 [Endobacter medicaginis]NVN28958.1 type IV secretion system protein VirB10 [Endobacter medicaginis]
MSGSDPRDPRDPEHNGHGINEGGSTVSTGPQLTMRQKLSVGGLISVIVLGFIWFNASHHKRPDQQQDQPQINGGLAMHAAPYIPPPAPPAAVPMPQPSHPFFAQQQKHEQTPAESAIFAFSGTTGGVPAPAPAVATAPGGEAGRQGGENPRSPLGDKLHPTVLETTKARLLPHPDFLITKGTIIPCTMQTAINTQLPGMVKCVVSQDIRSTTGNVVLLDKGTTISGEDQRGMLLGEDRTFVLWHRAETPQHAVIELDSPASDELGRSGLSVQVDNHWWARFGSAILLSVIQGGLDAGTQAASQISSKNGGSYFNSFQSNGQQVANTALQASINIPPTGTKNQGDDVAVFVARDLDFSDIYDLRTAGAGYGQ